MPSAGQRTLLLAAALLVAALPLVAAHGDEAAEMDMNMSVTATAAAATATSEALDPNDPWVITHNMESYFRHAHYTGWHMAHMILMIFAWVLIMPPALMLSVARSRYHLPAQLFFHLVNGLGIFTGFVYNHATPDLYEGNAHHTLGWVVTALTIAWTLMSLVVAYADFASADGKRIPTAAADPHPEMQYTGLTRYDDDISPTRLSKDSGHGTERDSNSLFSHSRQNSDQSVPLGKIELPSPAAFDSASEGEDEDDDNSFPPNPRRTLLGLTHIDAFLARRIPHLTSTPLTRTLRVLQILLEKFLLLLGFAAFTTGFITSGGIFRGQEIFSGLAHYIKGGIFVWYGFLTLGRWMGAFAEFGWAWNLRPAQSPAVAKWKTRVPSAEFVESFVIFLYGSSNVFLEHLSNAGGEWSPQDVEHVSITILFFGGGLLGMLIESRALRSLFNTSVALQQHHSPSPSTSSSFTIPQTDSLPLNPMPSLTIMLLGMMMSAHKQHSMVSTMLHAQWGGLFTATAIARFATYIILYLRPPTSHYPSRPPSELIASFCLTSGGILFMNSASDSVWSIESNGLDAMTVFTLTMGLTGVLLAWEMAVFALKGWAVRREVRGRLGVGL